MSKQRSPEDRRPARSARAEVAQQAERRRRVWIVAAAAVAGLIVAAIIIFLVRPGGEERLAFAPTAPEPLDNSIPRQGRVLGDPAAPVTVVEWGDYQ